MKQVEKVEADGWNNPGSSIVVEPNSAVPERIYGFYTYQSAQIKFSLHRQISGKYLMRGRVSIISPANGSIMRVSGRERTRRLEKYQGNKPAEGKTQDSCTGLSFLNITHDLYANTLNLDAIKARVARIAQKLYTENAAQLIRQLKQSVTPDTIIPAQAAALYTNEFLSINRRNCAEKTRQQYQRTIQSYYATLPSKPMAQCRPEDVKQNSKARGLPASTQKLLRDFWTFCIDKGVCHGINPFSPPKKRKFSPDVLRRKAFTPDVLPQKIQDRLYEILSQSARESGESVGIALQLWGGFSLKEVCTFRWGDVLLDGRLDDFVRISYRQDDKAGATHDYTRPVMPQAALLLRARYECLAEKYTPEQIKKMPVVAKKTNPKTVMTPDYLTQSTRRVLAQAGVGGEAMAALKKPKEAASTRMLITTYRHNIVYTCGLANDPGTAKFLQGFSLQGDVTSDHYTSFTCQEGQWRLYLILRRCGPKRPLEPRAMERLGDGTVTQFITPDHTQEIAGVLATLQMAPGELVKISCPCGVSGHISARGLTENGLRRKSPNHGKAAPQ